jgi:predicted NUDIX family NTP pyrophosphohydrolase
MNNSAGVLAYRYMKLLQVFLVHPGGPYFKNKDAGAWSIPKGEFTKEESPLQAAKREFLEETGYELKGDFIELKPVKQKAGKMVYAWAIQFDLDEQKIVSNSFLIEWPPRSGKMEAFPEIDKGGWFTVEEAKEKINPAQYELITELLEKLELREQSTK